MAWVSSRWRARPGPLFRFASRARCPLGFKAPCFAPAHRNSRWGTEPTIIGSTASPCCIASPSRTAPSPMPAASSRATPSAPLEAPARFPTPNSPPIRAALCLAASPPGSIRTLPTIAASMSWTMAATSSPSPRRRYRCASIPTRSRHSACSPTTRRCPAKSPPRTRITTQTRKRHYNYVVSFGLHSVYRLIAVSDNGAQQVVAEIPVDRPSYMHSFGMTERHLVLVEFPIVVSALELKFSGKPFIQNYRWLPERGLKFHLVEKDSGKVDNGHARRSMLRLPSCQRL